MWSDIPTSQVEVADGSGTTLGFGQLDDGHDTTNACVFETSFDVAEASDGN